jgi:protein TonB
LKGEVIGLAKSRLENGLPVTSAVLTDGVIKAGLGGVIIGGAAGGSGPALYSAAGMHRLSGGLTPGAIVKRVEPSYPELAKAARIKDSVMVEIVVDEEGNVASARALTGHPLLKPPAEAAARECKFTPTKLAGIPVKVIGSLTYHFQL